MWTLRVDPKGAIAFNQTLTPEAVLTSTNLASIAIQSIGGSENDSALGVSSVLRATPTVTTSNALFKQVAQAP